MQKVIFTWFFILVGVNVFAGENAAAYPVWFKSSELNLRADLSDVKAANKKYLILFMTQHDCGFCDLYIEKNWSDPDLIAYTKKHFEVLTVNVRGSRKLIDFYGKTLTEREYAHQHGFEFTPTLVFMDVDGHEVFRLPGLRSKRHFRAAMMYVVGEQYKKIKFRAYRDNLH